MSAEALTSPEKILLIRLKGIGDVILSTPVIRALRKAFPSAQIHMLTRGFCAPILANNPRLNKTIVLPEKSVSLSESLSFLRNLRVERYDWVLDLAAEPRSAWLTLATGAPLRAGYAFRVRKWAFNHPIPKNTVRKYQAEVNLDIIRYLGVPDEGNQTELFLSNEDIRWAGQVFLKQELASQKWKIGLNPTGTWPSKRWPVDHWKELIRLIHTEWGIKPILFGGPGDESLLEGIRSGLEEMTLLKPPTSLTQAAAYISRMDLLVGADGTPQHLAQAQNVKSLTLCGPHWGMSWMKPGDARHKYLQHFLDCGPCDLNECPFPVEKAKVQHVHQECLVRITPLKVLKVMGEMLKKDQ